MAKKKGKKKKPSKLHTLLRKDILSILAQNDKKPLNYKQISGFLKISDKELRKQLLNTLNQMVHEEVIIEVERGKYKMNRFSNVIEGVIEINLRGTGYITNENLTEDLFVPTKNLNGALNGDLVLAEIHQRGRKRPEGKVTKVIERRTKQFVGVLEVSGNHAFFIPDDPNINVDFFIPPEKLNGGRNGQKALVKLVKWNDSNKSPYGEVIDTFSANEETEAEAISIVSRLGLNYHFPDDVVSEAQNISFELDPEEIKRRRDFRDITTITIDPVDAKDFDDALSVEFLEENLFRIGVHIADVSHYVHPESALDKEAQIRGNSVYLVDRVIPMLPEHLSNGVCSLRPDEEKFSFSAVFDLDKNGVIKNEWFGKTVIKSNRRFAYEEAQEVIETKKGDFKKEILLLDGIAKKLRNKRLKAGALEIESSEIRFELDEDGKPVNVYKKVIKDANKLIEEFMLLANRRVGTYMGEIYKIHKTPLVYRIHDSPDEEKVGQFGQFLEKHGMSFAFKDERDISIQMNKVFEHFKGEPNFDMIQTMAIKSMAKAVYDTQNIGHYGLGFDYYAHFTSPIRRYADLLVHRILFDALHERFKAYPKLRDLAKHISITERKAVEAERTSKKYFQTLYLEDKVGEIFDGVITGLTDFGIFVEMKENFCEGMVMIRNIKGDRYQFDSDEYVVYGAQYGEEFTMGDEVRVKILQVSPDKKQIDLMLLV